MNIFSKVALQGMKKSRTRTIVTIIGAVLSAALITAVTTFCVSLLSYMTNGAVHKYGGWHVEFENVDSSFIEKQANSDKVANTVTFQNIGYAKLNGGKNPKKPYLFIAGFSEKTFDALRINVLSGRLPKNSGEILVSGRIMTKGGVQAKIGDTLTLAVGNRISGNKKLSQGNPYISGKETLASKAERTYKVVGICQTPYFEEDSAPGYTVITTSDAADTAHDLSLFVTMKNPRDVHAYAKSTAGSHAYLLNNEVLRFMGLSDSSDDEIFNTLLYSIGAIVILIIMIGSVFLIYNSFHISLNERTHQFGILSSVGATAKQLRHSVLFEGLCIGTIGIPIGIIVGIGSMGFVLSAVAKNFRNVMYDNVPLTLVVSAPAIIGAAAVSMVTILISADIPARKAASMPVMECIRQTNEVKIESKAVKTSKFAERIYGLEGTLALKNFKRNKKSYRGIVLSLTLSVVLFVSTNAFVMDFKQVSEQAKVVNGYDISFGAHDIDDSKMLQLYDKLKTAAGVTESSYQVVMNYSCAAKANDLSDAYLKSAGVHYPGKTVNLPMQIQFLDDRTYLKIIRGLGLPEKEYTGQNAKLIAVAKVQGSSNRDEKVSDIKDMFKSSSMNFTISHETNSELKKEHGQNVSITFVNTVPPDIPATAEMSKMQPDTIMGMAPYSLKEKLAHSETAANVRVKGMTFQSKNPSQSASQMQMMIQGEKITVPYLLLNSSKMLDQNRNIIFITNVFAYTFIIVISLIAIANVFNTISTNIKLRRREFAMFRSVGMSDHDFQKMMNFECAFYGMRTLLIGLPIAAVFSYLVYKGMTFKDGGIISFVFPWGSMAISIFGVLFIVFITMLYSTRKIKKENIIDALRDDMD